MLIENSTRKGKRFMVNVNGKTFHFGNLGSMTYIDHGDKDKRTNYIKRHAPNEDWTKINPGSLSRYLLWGESRNINKNIREYKKRFNI